MHTCHDCKTECEECDVQLIRGHFICIGCIENDYKACENCGEQYPMDSDELFDDDFGWYCAECYGEHRHSYHWYEEAI